MIRWRATGALSRPIIAVAITYLAAVTRDCGVVIVLVVVERLCCRQNKVFIAASPFCGRHPPSHKCEHDVELRQCTVKKHQP